MPTPSHRQTSRERRRERNSHAEIRRLEARYEGAGRSVLNANAAIARHERRRRAVLRRNAPVLRQHPGVSGIVLMLAVLALLPFVPFIDYAMASGATHFIVKTSFPYLGTHDLEMRKIGICIGIFLFEIVAGIVLSLLRDEGEIREGTYWASGGVLLALCMAGMTAVVTGAVPAMQLLAGPESAIPWLTGVIALLFHAAAIFGGDHIRFAFELLVLLLIAGWFYTAGAIAAASSRRGVAQFETSNRAYDRAREQHEQAFATAVARTRFAGDIEELQALIARRDTQERGTAQAPTAEPPAPPQVGPPQPAAPTQEPPTYADLFAEEEARRAETEVRA